MQYDVIIVGAGPAGSTAARQSALRGLSVLMLDRAEFPRDKPCGGGVTVRAAKILDLDLSAVTERTITGAKFSWHRRFDFSRESTGAVTYMTQRSYLDTFLAERAVDAGVTFRQREGLNGVERQGERVTVRAGGNAYRGRTLVIADGVNGSAARMAGIPTDFVHWIALEGNITPEGAFPDEWGTSMGFDFGSLAGGYGWVFPKRDHLNIGVGGWKHVGPKLRSNLDQLVSSHGFDPTDLWGVRGHHLPIRQRGSKLVDGNTLLVGDAAGVLDPLTGEGIYGAVWTGKAAASTIEGYLDGRTGSLDCYRQQVQSRLSPELTVGGQLHDVFHVCPGLFVGLERCASVLWPPFERMLRGEASYVSFTHGLGRLWPLLEFLSDSVRVFPPLRRMSGLNDSIPPQRFFQRAAANRTET